MSAPVTFSTFTTASGHSFGHAVLNNPAALNALTLPMIDLLDPQLKSWAEDDRPREKMLLKGRQALSDAELLAILLGSGTRSKSALELGKEILQNSGGDLFNFSKIFKNK